MTTKKTFAATDDTKTLRDLERADLFIQGLLVTMMIFAAGCVALFIGSELLATPEAITWIIAGVSAAIAAPFAIALIRKR